MPFISAQLGALQVDLEVPERVKPSEILTALGWQAAVCRQGIVDLFDLETAVRLEDGAHLEFIPHIEAAAASEPTATGWLGDWQRR